MQRRTFSLVDHGLLSDRFLGKSLRGYPMKNCWKAGGEEFTCHLAVKPSI
jgi:hypothetical protein